MLFSVLIATLLCTLGSGKPTPKAPKYDKVIQISPRAGPFAGEFLRSLLDGV